MNNEQHDWCSNSCWDVDSQPSSKGGGPTTQIKNGGGTRPPKKNGVEVALTLGGTCPPHCKAGVDAPIARVTRSQILVKMPSPINFVCKL